MEFVQPAPYRSNTPIYSFDFRNVFKVLDVGCGDSDRVLDFYPYAEVTKIDKKTGWDVLEQGLPSGEWDVIFANHIIEHLDDPDKFLESCKKVMKPYTVLDIGTPNLCAWFNRVLFLFGYLPHSYEVSYRKGYGRAFNWNFEEMGGHVRVFNVPALIQMISTHGFKMTYLKGEASFYPCNPLIRLADNILTINPNLASSFRLKCTL